MEGFIKEPYMVMEDGLTIFAKRRVINPARHEFYFNKGSVEAMPASDKDVFRCKIVNTHKNIEIIMDCPSYCK